MNNTKNHDIKSDQAFDDFISKLYQVDKKIDLKLDAQDNFQYDIFDNKNLDTSFLNRRDLTRFLGLLSLGYQFDFNPVNIVDNHSLDEVKEYILFMNFVENHILFYHTLDYLYKNLSINCANRDQILGYMYEVWFNKKGEKSLGINTNGFYHVFLGYQKHESIVGLHNWVKVYLSGKLKKRMFKITKHDDLTITLLSKTEKEPKEKLSTCLNGTSPIFDFLFYTAALIYCKTTNNEFEPNNTQYSLKCNINNQEINIIIVEKDGMILTSYIHTK